MRRIFVSVGTSLLAGRSDLLGCRALSRGLGSEVSLRRWWASEDPAAEELEADAVRRRLEELFSVDPGVDLGAGSDGGEPPSLATALHRCDAIRQTLRAEDGAGDADESLAQLSAEMSSLVHLRRCGVLRSSDRIVLLATDDPQGALAGLALRAILDDHPELLGIPAEVVWPGCWQPFDARRLAQAGARNLLRAVDRRLADDPQPARPFFVVTAGPKLGMAVMAQVASWGQVVDHDGMFLKAQEPGGRFFPPFRFGERTDENGSSRGGLVSSRPGSDEVAAQIGDLRGVEMGLRRVVDEVRRLGRGRSRSSRPRTTLLVSCGAGLVAPPRLRERFGLSCLAHPGLWQAVHRHWGRTWENVRSTPVTWNPVTRDPVIGETSQASEAPTDGAGTPEIPAAWPTDEDLLAAIDSVGRDLGPAWEQGATSELTAELAFLRALWDGDSRTWIVGDEPRIVLLATDTLVGEVCASWVADFLRRRAGGAQVELAVVPGLHPHGVAGGEGADADPFSVLADRFAEELELADRILVAPMGGSKVHVPALSVLATAIGAPLLMGHERLGEAVLVPWLERRGGGVGSANPQEIWPELAGLPVVHLGGPDR